MGFKKYDGNVWQAITPKQLKGIPYTGTLPAVLTGTKAGYLHKFKIYGNLTQNGTPTPENSIVPSECGERTENLFDIEPGMLDVANWEPFAYYGTTYFMYYELPETIVSSIKSIGIISAKGFLKQGGTYYSGEVFGLTADKTGNLASNRRILDNNGTLKDYTADFSSATNLYLAIGIGTGITDANKQTLIDAFWNNYNLSIIAGSTAPTEYIPFGYKLPLASAGQDVDIYLAEGQTTRRIKNLVLTGEETWSFYGEGNVWQFYTNNILSGLANSSCVSNIAGYGATASTRERYNYGAYLVSSGRGIAFQMKGSKDTLVDVAAWKTYLADQYASDTPVTIWYILATEETGTLNEPLRKIGDYADTIDSTQTTAQIPTTANSTTISWDGQGLTPSQFDSIQEWVDIPTYTRVNGEWVEDN